MGLRADITKLKKEVKRMAGSEVFDLLARAVDGDESAAHKLLTRREGDGRTDNLDQLYLAIVNAPQAGGGALY